ncbi:MAG: 7-cyano-7-deazaguanine synthase QueC [Phycisphaerales bacterium]|nr:7-cyano-7-deazaguanine synthase QueC [Phycisphaerales bacterium]
MTKAIVLVSGGLDSATILAMALRDGLACTAVSFDYDQRHRGELASATAVCRSMGVNDHRIVRIDPGPLSGSALTGGGDVPHPVDVDQIGGGIPDTYVPARNTVFLALSLAMAEGLGASELHIGANAVDYSGYPDCRPEFISAFDSLAQVATKAGVEGNPIRVKAPLLYMSKAEIITTGSQLGVDYGLTCSCYDPGEGSQPCGQCDACFLRAAGFAQAGVPDPLLEAST